MQTITAVVSAWKITRRPTRRQRPASAIPFSKHHGHCLIRGPKAPYWRHAWMLLMTSVATREATNEDHAAALVPKSWDW